MRAVLIFLQPEPTRMRIYIFGDNKGAKVIADNPSSASRTKHIDVKLQIIRGLIRAGELRDLHMGTAEQHADVLPKSLWRKKSAAPCSFNESFLRQFLERVS